MLDLTKIKEALEGYEDSNWNSYAGDYTYDEILDFFQFEVDDDRPWHVDVSGNIWFPPLDDERPTTENQSPFFNIL